MLTATQSGIKNKFFQLISAEIKHFYQVTALLTCLVIAGCGGGSSDSGGTNTTLETVTLKGSVGDGPVVGATITVKDANGAIVATTTSNNAAAYEIDVPGKTLFPATITATGGTDIVSGTIPDFSMVTVALKKADLNSKKRTVNINPFSTFIVQMAQSMNGGLNEQNISSAKQTLFDSFSFGLDSSLIADPISTDIDDTNIAGIVKASESVGEMIRRTRDAMISSGSNIDGDYVLNKLANDLADGKLDASGRNVASAVTATAKIVSAQVLIETLRNRLKVNGTIATDLLDSAIITSHSTATMTTSDVTLTTDVITQAKTALEAVKRFAPSSEISTLSNQVSNLDNTVSISEVYSTLSNGSESIITAVINLVPLATEEELNSIFNDTNTTAPTIEPIAPVINSSPVLTVTEGDTYSYDVNASDDNPDDTLVYSLSNAPVGMNINSTTGLISWTPDNSQAGSQNVTVTVTDDSSSSLSANQTFSIAITAINTIPNNIAPMISSNAILTATSGIAYNYDVNAIDANTSDILTYSLTTAPSGMMINSSNGIISWTPSSSQIGTQNVTIKVSDDGSPSLSANQGFTIAVTAANVAPIITSKPSLIAQEGVAYSYDVNSTDVNSGDTLNYTLTTAPVGMSINASNGLITWTPDSSQLGSHNVTILAADNGLPVLSANQSFTVTVNSISSLNISNTTPSTYIWNTLENNKLMFSDRTYLFGTDADNQVHPSYSGMNYLATAKRDRSTYGDTLISFTVNTPITVYVAHDERIINKPSWLSTWEDTGDDMASRSIFRKDFDEGTITLGGNTENGIETGSMYFVFINPRIQISDTKVIIDGTNGTANAENNATSYISVSHTIGDTLTLANQPANGSAQIVDGNIIQYTPDNNFSGIDSISYEITDGNGNISIDTITITVSCTDCIKTSIFDLYWDPTNTSETGYRIYFGANEDTASKLGYDVTVSSLSNPQAPSVVIRSDDLGLQPGDPACFRIKTYDGTNNTSDFSNAVCTTI